MVNHQVSKDVRELELRIAELEERVARVMVRRVQAEARMHERLRAEVAKVRLFCDLSQRHVMLGGDYWINDPHIGMMERGYSHWGIH